MRTGSLLYLTKEDLFNGNIDNINDITVADLGILPRQVMNQYDLTVFYDEDFETLKVLENRFGQTSISGMDNINEISMISKLKMLWFSRWLAMNYCDVLNTETGIWYIEQIKFFNVSVFPNMLKTSIEAGLLDETFKTIKEIY